MNEGQGYGYEAPQQPNNSSYQGNMYNNYGYETATALQIRLNTEPLQRQIEMFLRGKTEQLSINDDGTEVLKSIDIGEPLCNEKGVQNIMMFIEMVFNVQVVQANFKDEYEYEEYLYRTRKDLAKELIVNLNNYGISRNHYAGIISKIMRFVEAFMTRPKDNRERESYSNTIRTTESVRNEPSKKKGWLPF